VQEVHRSQGSGGLEVGRGRRRTGSGGRSWRAGRRGGVSAAGREWRLQAAWPAAKAGESHLSGRGRKQRRRRSLEVGRGPRSHACMRRFVLAPQRAEHRSPRGVGELLDAAAARTTRAAYPFGAEHNSRVPPFALMGRPNKKVRAQC
jgi:hypothetical protein